MLYVVYNMRGWSLLLAAESQISALEIFFNLSLTDSHDFTITFGIRSILKDKDNRTKHLGGCWRGLRSAFSWRAGKHGAIAVI